MAGRVLLDANVAIALLDGQPTVEQAVSEAGEVFLSSTVVGELFYGSLSSRRKDENLARLRSFVESIVTLPSDRDTAFVYGEIKSALRAKGRPIPDNDLWIAAIAKQHDLTLITRDKHFSEIVDLEVQSW